MRMVIADCSAIYTGRGDTQLPRGIRSIMIKNDGSVSIHNDVGNKPLNYMKEAHFTSSETSFKELVWTFDTRKESLSIIIHKLISETEYDLIQEDPGLQRDGTEDQLQEWLSKHPEVFGEGYSLVSREYPTGNGPVDLFLLDERGDPVSVEVKRVAMIGAVDQCRRYTDALKEQEISENGINFLNVRGLIAALDIRPKTVEYAKKHNISLLTIPSSWRDDNITEISQSSQLDNSPNTLF